MMSEKSLIHCTLWICTAPEGQREIRLVEPTRKDLWQLRGVQTWIWWI